MTASIAFQPPVDFETPEDVAPKGFSKFAGSLLSRVQKAGQNLRDAGKSLRNISREDAAYMGANVAVGLGVKALTVAALGVASGGSVFALAAVGGAAVGLTRAALKHVRSGKSMREFINPEAFSRDNLSKLVSLETYSRASINKFFKGDSVLKTTVSSMAISVATLGYSELFEFTSGQTFSHFLGNAFNKVADFATDKVIDLVSGTDAFQAATTEALQNQNYASGLIQQAKPIYAPLPDTPAAAPVVQAAAPAAPTHQPTYQASRPSVQHAAATKVAIDTALVAAQEKANGDYALNRLRELIQNTTGVAAPETATAAELAKQFHPSNPDAFLKGLQQQAPILQAAQPAAIPAAATATRGIASAAATDAPVSAKAIVPATATPNELAEQAVAKVKLVLTQDELTNHYTLERLQEMVKATTGIDAPADATVEDLMKQLQPANADAFLKEIQQQAPQLKVENLAASCTTEIPKEKSAVNVIKTLCYKFQEHMTSSSIVTVDNVNEAEPKKGLRLLYRKAVSALGGTSGTPTTESTNNFIGENVSGPNGVVQEMTEAALAL